MFQVDSFHHSVLYFGDTRFCGPEYHEDVEILDEQGRPFQDLQEQGMFYPVAWDGNYRIDLGDDGLVTITNPRRQVVSKPALIKRKEDADEEYRRKRRKLMFSSSLFTNDYYQ